MTDQTELAGRTAVVTGAGAGLGRAEALALAAAGANVVINDIDERAQDVVEEITGAGGGAVAVLGDIGEWASGQQLVDAALEHFGSLDIVVNNAGITRDTMIFNLTEDAWDDVLRIHLKGHAALSAAAAVHWRAKAKETGEPVDASVINTSSEAFLFGPAGQPNYGAAKAGIVALTLSTNAGLSRYGVRANAICPRARTAMTQEVFDDHTAEGLDPLAPERPANLVAYLASPAAREITGQVFVVYSDFVALMGAPEAEHVFRADDGFFEVAELDTKLSTYFQGRGQYETYAAYSLAKLDNTGA